jgi:hypothetical protein
MTRNSLSVQAAARELRVLAERHLRRAARSQDRHGVRTERAHARLDARPGEWDPAAVDAARAELARRDVDVPARGEPLEVPIRRSFAAMDIAAMVFGALLILLAIVVLFVAGPSVAALAPAVSGAALVVYFGTRKR